MKKTLYLLSIILIAVSCKETKNEVVNEVNDGLITVSKAQFKNMEMQIETPKEQDFDQTVKTSGKIDVPPQNRAKVSTFVDGFIKSSNLLVGDKVSKGQALFTIQSTEVVDIQKEYLEVAEQMVYLKSEFNRQKTLFDEKITSQKNYLKAESEYKSARGRYQSLRQKLLMFNINPAQTERGNITSTITVFAPISGDITVMNANVGMAVAPSDVILEIVNNKDIHLEMDVFEKDILKIKENQTIKFTITEASTEEFFGKVHLIGKSIEGNERTTNVHGHIDDNVKQKLLTGMFFEAKIVVDSKKGLAIPKEALGFENEKYFVLLLAKEDDKGFHFQKVQVEKGESTEDFVEIIPSNKINQNSKLLTKGIFDIIN
jgi:cobalt-zinc-cadmium efflux system membrane fusion protein